MWHERKACPWASVKSENFNNSTKNWIVLELHLQQTFFSSDWVEWLGVVMLHYRTYASHNISSFHLKVMHEVPMIVILWKNSASKNVKCKILDRHIKHSHTFRVTASLRDLLNRYVRFPIIKRRISLLCQVWRGRTTSGKRDYYP